MLKQAAEFPHPGAMAYLAPDAAPVRIQRHNPDGTALITLVPCEGCDLTAAGRAEARSLRQRASGNRTEPLANLHPTAAEALGLEPTRQHKRARRRSAR